MAEVKDKTKELEAQLKEAQEQIQKLNEIANGYFKAYRNLLGQLNLTVQTHQDVDAGLQEKLK
jgi:predicted  nucleic acid-binding Zn-ribbon protein